jgi:hypothetical protein
MADGYCCKRASVSAIDKLLPIALIKSRQTTEIGVTGLGIVHQGDSHAVLP